MRMVHVMRESIDTKEVYLTFRSIPDSRMLIRVLLFTIISHRLRRMDTIFAAHQTLPGLHLTETIDVEDRRQEENRTEAEIEHHRAPLRIPRSDGLVTEYQSPRMSLERSVLCQRLKIER